MVKSPGLVEDEMEDKDKEGVIPFLLPEYPTFARHKFPGFVPVVPLLPLTCRCTARSGPFFISNLLLAIKQKKSSMGVRVSAVFFYVFIDPINNAIDRHQSTAESSFG